MSFVGRWLPSEVEDFGVDLAVLAGIIVSVGVIAKTRLGRAVAGLTKRTYRRAVGQPVTSWLIDLVQRAVDPKIEALSQRNDAQHEDNASRLTAIEGRVAVMETNVEVVATIVTGHAERLERGSEAMGGIKTSLDQLARDVAGLRKPTPSLPPKEDPAA